MFGRPRGGGVPRHCNYVAAESSHVAWVAWRDTAPDGRRDALEGRPATIGAGLPHGSSGVYRPAAAPIR
ncbi:hypothetical protein ACFPM0_06655 [Pseudonocardia sulfidoxydans]|uniref:hypothetical protein n=1 Tax=Pseudonocardia sulfidoxydans TaxID=54011 RepID=UPI00360DAE01